MSCSAGIITVTSPDDIAVTVSYRRISIIMLGRGWTTKNPQAFIHAGFLDFFGLLRTLNWWGGVNRIVK
jgi:hypothetical protein